MGYRAVAITEHIGITIPQWFKDKWDEQLNISQYSEYTGENYRGKPSTPISYKWERKFHDDFMEDLQKVLVQDTEWSGNKLQIIMMHEDGKVNRITIYKDRIVIEEPEGWEEVDDVHCY